MSFHFFINVDPAAAVLDEEKDRPTEQNGQANRTGQTM